jgi:hypothetical protein
MRKTGDGTMREEYIYPETSVETLSVSSLLQTLENGGGSGLEQGEGRIPARLM